MNTVEDVQEISFKVNRNSTGSLVAFEQEVNLPMNLARVFMVAALQDEIRGHHAHKTCSQLLVCTSGTIEVVCDDGLKTRSFLLNDFSKGLFIPNGIWAHQVYKDANSVLTVFCDYKYDESDYMRDREQFCEFRRVK